MALRRLRQARAAQNAVTNPQPLQIAMMVIGAIGLAPAIGLALICLISIFALTQSSLSAPSPYGSGGPSPGMSGDPLAGLFGGDGKGAFARDRVPKPEIADAIEAAAKECDLLSPAILAAQIELESGFDASLTGPDGGQGLAQMAPATFEKYGEDDDDNGKTSAFDVKDAVFAQARHLCALGKEVDGLLRDGKATGDRLTLTLLAWHVGIDGVRQLGGMPAPDLGSYPYQVRSLIDKYRTGEPEPSAGPSASVPGKAPGPSSGTLTEAQYAEMFPSRNPFYTYAGLADAMRAFPAFAGTGDDATRKRELAAFLANIDHESGGLVYVEEINQAAWGDYCDAAQPYGCPAGPTAYHGRGPIQLSWNTNYKAAGDALGIDLLREPDRVKNDPKVAWQTALWFWMTQSGAGHSTAHAAITSGGGFGETIRTINGVRECNGGNPGQVQSRVAAYRRFAGLLGVDPGDRLTC